MNIPPVNFLPWRQRRFRRLLHRWLGWVGVIWLLCGVLAFVGRGYWLSVAAVSNVHAEAERVLVQQLTQREQALQAGLQQQAVLKKRQRTRQLTEAWSPRLLALAEHLPTSAWLSELSYRDGMLVLSGVLTSFSALAEVEQTLRAIPGFRLGQAGKIKRDSTGRWQFQYALREESGNAPP